MENYGDQTVKLKSKRTNEEYDLTLYEKDGALVVYHAVLEKIFYNMEDDQRPEMTIEPFDLTKMPGIPPMFAVKCTLKKGCTVIEQIGEMLCQTWQYTDEVKHNFPLCICQNRAFDRAFIRYMQFDIGEFNGRALYSSEEIAISKDMTVLVRGTTAAQTVPVQQAMPPQQGFTQPASAYPMDAPEQTSGITQSEGNWFSSADRQQDSCPESGFTESPQPVPWPNVPARQNPLPSSIQMPDVGPSNLRNLQITQVAYDPVQKKVYIDTTSGIVYFDPDNGTWSSPSLDLQEVDLRALYTRACQFAGKDIRTLRC